MDIVRKRPKKVLADAQIFKRDKLVEFNTHTYMEPGNLNKLGRLYQCSYPSCDITSFCKMLALQ